MPKLLLLLQQDPSYSTSYRYLAACYAHMGRLDDAREAITRLRTVTSVVMRELGYLRDAEHRELFITAQKPAVGERDRPRTAVTLRSSPPIRCAETPTSTSSLPLDPQPPLRFRPAPANICPSRR